MHNIWFPVEWSDRVKANPLGIILNGIPLVLFRSEERMQVLADRCPHRGVPLSKGFIREGCLVCPYHGWQFKGNGTCHSIPGINCYSSKKIHQVPSYQVKERYGLIWVCLDPTSKHAIPEIAIGSNEKRSHLSTQINSSLRDIVENALDPLHTHFVHSGWIRSDTKRQPILIKMRMEQNWIEAEYCNELKQQGWAHKILSFGRQVEKSFGRFIYPSLFQLEFRTTKQERFLINGFLSPINEQNSKIFLVSSTDASIPGFIFKALVKPLFAIAMRQDKKILEMRSKHIQKFGIGKEISTQGDLFGPYLDLLFKGKSIPKKEYEISLYV
ncbi:MAG: Rieske 2Fe-2S domain-containing protein [Candidatus Rhabdochlamydia sp.]